MLIHLDREQKLPIRKILFPTWGYAIMMKFLSYHYHVYEKLALQYWAHQTPMQYFGLLIFIAFAGWVMMKAATKKN